VRRACPACAGAGCRDCGDAGYRGRRAIAEILVASPEFERRVAAAAPPERIANAARANGCVSLWESGLALVRRGETTIDELRRVCAEPAKAVTVPAVAAGARTGVVRIGWWSARAGAVSGAVRGQLVAAAAADSGVEIVVLSGQCDLAAPLDAVVVLGTSAVEAQPEPKPWAIGSAREPLVVALAPDGATNEHLRLLARDASVVLPAGTHGRVVLATVVSLLRWRGG
jgi:hypothetical protein